MRPDTAKKLQPETLFKADTATIAVKAEPDGKLRINYHGWADVKIIFPGEALELRWEQGQVWARRTRKPRPTGLP